MRWKGLIFLVIFLSAIILISIFFIDKWVEAGLEKAGELAVGAKVEIDNLNFSLIKLTIEWDRLQVTDPKNTMQNIIETGTVSFKMNSPALFRKKYIIEEMTLAGIKTATPRMNDGALPKKDEPISEKDAKPDMIDKTKIKLEKEIKNLPIMNFDMDNIKKNLNVDKLIETADIKIIGKLDSVKNDITTTTDKWQTFYKTFKPENDLKKIKTDFENIEPKNIKDIPTLIKTVDKIKSARDRLQKINDDVNVKHEEIRNDYNRLSIYTTQVDNWFSEDYQNLLRKAKLPDLNVKNIGKILFGATVVKKFNKYLDYLKFVRKYMPKKSETSKKDTSKRMAGQVIHFPTFNNWPSFLIKNINLSGQTGPTKEEPGLNISGDITGITSQPWIYNKPAIVELKAHQQNDPSGSLTAVLDHITDISNDSFNINLTAVSLNNYDLHKSQYLPSKISKGTADFTSNIKFKDDDFLANIKVKANNLDFDFSQVQTTNKFVDIVREVINDIDILTLDINLSGRSDDLDFKLNSNLDQLISKKLKSMGSKALKDAQNKIRSRLNKIKNEKKAEADKLYSQKRGEIEKKIEKYKDQIDEQKKKIEQKTEKLQNELAKRRKDQEEKIKKKAKNAIDNLFKKKS